MNPPLPQGTRRTYRRLLRYPQGFGTAFRLGILGSVLFAATQSAFLWFLKVFLDGTFFKHDPRVLAWVPIGIVALFALRGLGDFTQTYFMSIVGCGIVKKMRAQIFERLMHLPVAYFDKNTSGVILSRLTYNTEQVAQAATDSVISLVRESLIIVGSLVYLFTVNVRLTLVALTVAPVITLLIRSISRHFRRYGQRLQNSMGDVTRIAKEAIEAPRMVRVYNAQRHEIEQFEGVNERNRSVSMKVALTRALSNPIVQMLASLALAVVLFIAMHEALAGRLTPGEFVSFIGALANMTQPLRNLVNVAGPLQQGIAAAAGIFELLDESAEPRSGIVEFKRARGEVEFRHVGFSYAGERATAIRNLSFTIQPGEVMAIVGRSGSGKSTLVNLLPRLYDASAGRVLIDGTDVRQYELDSLRDQIALVSQDVVLFNDTIRNNISFGRAASPEDIDRAAAAARVLEFTNQLPQGLETIVGDRGVLLSGGQRQRISIARALLRNAPILILDEATAALDPETERAIQEELEALMHGRTTLVIAHRLSTVEKASRIIVMDAGSVVEVGIHADLLSRNGPYASLYRRQFAD